MAICSSVLLEAKGMFPSFVVDVSTTQNNDPLEGYRRHPGRINMCLLDKPVARNVAC